MATFVRQAGSPPPVFGTVGLLTVGALLLSACGPGPAGPSVHDPDPDQPSVQDPVPEAMTEIRMRISEGIPPVDFAVVLHGPTGALWGERCEKGCSFQPGETLLSLHAQQVWYLSALFLEAGVHRMKELDFGPGCYGELYVEVIYRYEGGEGSFQGCTTKLPQALQAAVGAFQGLLEGRLPLVVDPETRPDRWPQDPFSVKDAEVAGGFLKVTVSYGGGCNPHEFQGVAWGGWEGSDPLQIKVFLSHDSFRDPCLAVITEERYFDLETLKRAYRRSYGIGAPGATTLVIQLENHTGEGPPLQRSLEFRF